MAKTTPKLKTQYVCAECGATAPKLLGRCPDCGAWNSMAETVIEPESTHRYAARSQNALAAASTVQGLADIEASELPRFSTAIEEFDRVLGGGLVAGGVVLIGGDPGIGKSTLLLQALANMAQAGKRVLYVSGEESAAQVALRARRLGVISDGSKVPGLRLQAEIQLEKIEAAISAEQPEVVVIDSIQTLFSEQLTSAPGSVTQVRECSAQLTRMAKRDGVTVILVGHVTKEGALAGPRVLEHIVDTEIGRAHV